MTDIWDLPPISDEALVAFALFCREAPQEVLLDNLRLRRTFLAYAQAFGPEPAEVPHG